MHLNEAFTYLSAFVLGGKFMEHYNRDNFEKSHTSEELYHRTSRSQSNSLKRKDFVVSFIASAIVGSAVGLYYKIKYIKTDELKEKNKIYVVKLKTIDNERKIQWFLLNLKLSN